MPRDQILRSTCRLVVLLFSGLLAMNSGWSWQSARAENVGLKAGHIALSGGSPSGIWQTGDVAVDYQFVKSGSQIQFSGKINFTDRVSDTFNTVDYFKLTVAFLDDQGKELSSSELLTKINFSSRAGGPGFSKALNLPQGAISFAFGYSGQAHSPSTGDAIPFAKSFSHRPTQ